jgi:transcriptional regulator with XRE-family HTH domain
MKMLRESHGWDQSTLARRAGVSPSYVSRLEAGKHVKPGAGKLRLIAEALGETLESLTGEPSGAPAVMVFGGVVGVPLVRWSAHAGSSAVWQESGPREWLPAEMERGRRLLAAEVIGRCLSPEIEPGDVVIFDQNRREPQDGEIAVITTASAGVFCKRVFRVGDVVRLYPDDGDVPPGEDVTIEGTALRVVKKLNRS